MLFIITTIVVVLYILPRIFYGPLIIERTPHRFTVAPEDQACQYDSDCVLVSTDCSGCECGTPVNKIHQTKYANKREVLCKDYRGGVCEFLCSTPYTKCIDHRCALSTSEANLPFIPTTYAECFYSGRNISDLECTYARVEADRNKYLHCINVGGVIEKTNDLGKEVDQCTLTFYNPDYIFPKDFEGCKNGHAPWLREAIDERGVCTVEVKNFGIYNKDIADQLVAVCFVSHQESRDIDTAEKVACTLTFKEIYDTPLSILDIHDEWSLGFTKVLHESLFEKFRSYEVATNKYLLHDVQLISNNRALIRVDNGHAYTNVIIESGKKGGKFIHKIIHIFNLIPRIPTQLNVIPAGVYFSQESWEIYRAQYGDVNFIPRNYPPNTTNVTPENLFVKPTVGTGEKENCEKEGGEWQRAGSVDLYQCVHPFSDGGKSCQNSNDCNGDCIVRDPKNPQAFCQYDDNPFGCYSTVEDFRHDQAILCRD